MIPLNFLMFEMTNAMVIGQKAGPLNFFNYDYYWHTGTIGVLTMVVWLFQLVMGPVLRPSCVIEPINRVLHSQISTPRVFKVKEKDFPKFNGNRSQYSDWRHGLLIWMRRAGLNKLIDPNNKPPSLDTNSARRDLKKKVPNGRNADDWIQDQIDTRDRLIEQWTEHQQNFFDDLIEATRDDEKGLELYSTDVTAAYLNAKASTPLIMRLPEGYRKYDKDGNELGLELNRTCYGLPDAGSQWAKELARNLTERHYTRCRSDPMLWRKIETDPNTGRTESIYMVIHVDDIIYATDSDRMRNELLQILEHEYGCRDLGKLKECLGTEIDYDRRAGILKQCQRKYIEEACTKFGITNTATTPARTDLVLDSPTDDDTLCKTDQQRYMQMVGSLNYIANGTRPDISAITSVLGQFMQVAGREHLAAARRVFEYLKGSSGQCLTFTRGSRHPNRFFIACDASHGDRGKTGNGWRRSRSGIVILMNGAAVSWISRSQSCVAVSTAEAEYIALCLAAQEQNWLREILAFLGHEQTEPTTIY